MFEVTDEMLQVLKDYCDFYISGADAIERIIELHEQSKPKPEPVAYKVCNPAGCIFVESRKSAEKLTSEYGDGTYQPLYTELYTQEDVEVKAKEDV